MFWDNFSTRAKQFSQTFKILGQKLWGEIIFKNFSNFGSKNSKKVASMKNSKNFQNFHFSVNFLRFWIKFHPPKSTPPKKPGMAIFRGPKRPPTRRFGRGVAKFRLFGHFSLRICIGDSPFMTCHFRFLSTFDPQ